MGLDRYGASAPGPVAMKELGFTPENVASTVRALLGALALPQSGAQLDARHLGEAIAGLRRGRR